MMKGYNELYLNDAMRNLGDAVEYALCDLKLEPDTFFGYFITSGIADQFGAGNPKYVAGMSGVELVESVLRAVNVSFESQPAYHTEFKGREYWSGWIFAYYQWETGRRFRDIVSDGLTLSVVMSMYVLHEADERKFVEEANTFISRNQKNSKAKLAKIRKARGFTQAELAETAGITLRMVQLYEQRRNDINKAQVDTVLALSKALGCGIEDILE